MPGEPSKFMILGLHKVPIILICFIFFLFKYGLAVVMPLIAY